MKFLHTSDLHIGKKLDSILRLDEQEQVLSEICEIAVSEKVDIVLIAGDVFDTFLPSAEAENLFFEFIDDLSQKGRCVVAVSGNHDDGSRLSASKTLSSRRGVFLCNGDNSFKFGKYGSVNLIGVDKNYLVFEKDGEQVFIATVPYFGEAPIGFTVDKETSYSERVESILKQIFENKKEGQTGILVTHLFMLGGQTTDGERNIDLGGVKVVSPAAIPDCCKYTALGHLHKRQIASQSKNVLYSGSPLQYSYDEVGNEKSVTIFETKNGEVDGVAAVPLKKGKKLVRQTVDGVDSLDVKLSKYADNFVDLTILSDRPLTLEESAKIKEEFPFVTKLRLEFSSSIDGDRITGRKHLSDKELFVEFYKTKYGSEPDEELLSCYLEIISEE